MHLLSHLVLATVALPAALANPFCSEQGPGTCTVTIWGRFITDNGFERTELSQAVISDNNCNDLSDYQRFWRNPWGRSHVPLFSSLPLIVDVSFVGSDNNQFDVCYANKCYKGGVQCELRDDGNNYCQRVFNCF